MEKPDSAQFHATGWLGPVDLLTISETHILNKYLLDKQRPAPKNWGKGLAASDRIIFDLSRDPRIQALLKPLLGEHFFIWGAQVIERSPGELHPWHTDIETANSGGKAVTVWIALENASVESSLSFISGSHLFDKPLQQAASEYCLRRELRTAEASLQLARSFSSDTVLVQPSISDGEALVFDGRIWHGSLNRRDSGTRRALLLQYATPDLEIKIPNWAQLDWPFEFKPSPKPSVVMVSGKNSGGLNRVVAPPPAQPEASRSLENLTVPIPQPLPRDISKGWRPNPLYRGSTPVLRKLSCHASVLEPECIPHPPHCHLDEEILVILDGEADIVIAKSEDDSAPRIERMHRGDMVYYPSYQFHTIHCSGNSPVSYFMYRWNASIRPTEKAIDIMIFRGMNEWVFDGSRPFEASQVFEGPTGLLEKLHLHLSRAQKGGGYAEHQDQHDVAMLLFEGAVKTMGRVVHAPAVILHPARALHGLRGASESPALYLVVEFHGPHAEPSTILEAARRKTILVLEDLKARVRWRLKVLRSYIAGR